MIKKIFPYEDFLYILQLEEYYYDRFFKKIFQLFFKRGFMIHEKLVFTSRIKITYLFSVILTIYIPVLLSFIALLILNNFILVIFISIGLLLLSIIFIPLWVGFSSLMLEPFYFVIKKNLQKEAKKLVNDVDTKNIMIVGSYGKTTTKNFIQQLIQYNYKSQMVAGNINTPTGIAAWLLKNLDRNAEILIAETDGYKLGEVADCCKIISPDIVVITAIGDQHLERLKSRKMLAMTLLEAMQYSNKEAKFILTKDTVTDFETLGIDIFKLYEKERFIIIENNENMQYEGKEIIAKELSEVNKYNAQFALKVCEILSIPQEYVVDEMKKLKIPDRRSQEITRDEFMTIDNSYNISLNTAKAGVLDGLRKAKESSKKLVVITGGIPEVGDENRQANFEYGQFLFKNNIERLIVLKTSLAVEILNGYSFNNKDAENTPLIASSMIEAWNQIKETYNPKEVLVLMQPELNDLYYIDTNFSTISVE